MLHIANPIYDSAFKYLFEDEISTAIENRDTEIMVYKQKVIIQSEELSHKEEQLNRQSEQLNKQSEQLNKQSEQLNKQSEQLASAIRLLHSNGVTDEMIASSLNVGLEDVRNILK